jgi:hypothetical protein
MRTTSTTATPQRVAELSRWLDQGCGLCRLLWDSASLLVDLDIDYVNFDFPAEPFLDPSRTFALQQAVMVTVKERLLAFGIAPLHLLSGRSHDFFWCSGRQSGCFERLKGLGRPAPSLLAHCERTPRPGGAHLDLALGRAYHGLGQVMEYLAAEVKTVVQASVRSYLLRHFRGADCDSERYCQMLCTGWWRILLGY